MIRWLRLWPVLWSWFIFGFILRLGFGLILWLRLILRLGFWLVLRLRFILGSRLVLGLWFILRLRFVLWLGLVRRLLRFRFIR